MRKIVFLAAMALLCASCFSVNKNYRGGRNAVRGEGAVVSRTYDLSGFDAIVVNGHADVTFTQADTYEVTLRTQENIFEYMDFHVDGTTLVLETKDKREIRAEEYDVTVKAPSLVRVEVNGAADVDIPAGLKMDGDFRCEVNGAGDLDLSGIVCNRCYLEVNGAADIEASGLSVQALKVVINGAGDVDLHGEAVDADLGVSGAGDIDARGLKVSGEVKKRAAGVASIKI